MVELSKKYLASVERTTAEVGFYQRDAMHKRSSHCCLSVKIRHCVKTA